MSLFQISCFLRFYIFRVIYTESWRLFASKRGMGRSPCLPGGLFLGESRSQFVFPSVVDMFTELPSIKHNPSSFLPRLSKLQVSHLPSSLVLLNAHRRVRICSPSLPQPPYIDLQKWKSAQSKKSQSTYNATNSQIPFQSIYHCLLFLPFSSQPSSLQHLWYAPHSPYRLIAYSLGCQQENDIHESVHVKADLD